jgi:hypothetical protein
MSFESGRRIAPIGVAAMVVAGLTLIAGCAGGTSSAPTPGTGAGWAIQPTPNPSGAGSKPGAGALLFDVSCASTSFCTAVGYSGNGDAADGGPAVTTALAERWDGTSWMIDSTAGLGAALAGVSCQSSTSCTAVGFSTDSSGGDNALAAHWNGGTWAIEPVPTPPPAANSDQPGSSELYGLSCLSTAACTAVGYYEYSPSNVTVTLVERWNGVSWAIQQSPNPSATFVSLSDVSCPSSTSCTAVGEYATNISEDNLAPLTESWNGTSWAINSMPAPSGGNSVIDYVSCPSTTDCTAVGYHESKPPQTVTLAEHWNGTSWAIEPTPDPPVTDSDSLNSVSCPSTTSCTAVGYSGSLARRSGDSATLVESWNGTSWAIQSTPDRSGEGYHAHVPCPSTDTSCLLVGNVLSGVSCLLSGSCTAIGASTESSGLELTLAERS